MKKNQEMYREDILSKVRQIWFDNDSVNLSLPKLAENIGIHPQILLHTFGSAESLLAQALSPNGKPPETVITENEYPQNIGQPELVIQNKNTDHVRNRIWDAYKALTPSVNPDLETFEEVNYSER